MTSEPAHVSLGEAARAWAYVGLNSFGGPAGQIAVMHREIVERRRWLDERRFLDALNYCMLLPGPEAQQLATYSGWLLNGIRGGLIAGLLFILPGIFVLLALSILYALFADTTLSTALFYGIKPAVVALVADAVLRLGRRAIKGRRQAGIAVAAFVAIYFFDVWFPLIIIGAGALGLLLSRMSDAQAPPEAAAVRPRPRTRDALLVAGACLIVWLLPVAFSFFVLGPGSIFTQLALFFSFAALITFGGAYAVLAYVAQQAVDVYGWLTPNQMLDGLGLAESTPGPLIMVVQFVGFMAAFGRPEGLDPLAAGVFGALLVTWVTFAPSFLWIFGGAPFVEHARERPTLAAALSVITPAVVGVIANLAVWFALQTFFSTTGEVRYSALRLHTVDLASIDLFAVGLAAAAFVALTRLRIPLLAVLVGSALAGAAFYVVVGPGAG